MRLRAVFPLILLFIVGCGGRTPGGTWRDLDGGTTPPDAVVSGEFCEGQAKVELNDSLTIGLPITSSPIAMGCCDGAELRFHLQSVHGFDVTVHIQAWTMWVPGDFSLGDVTEGGIMVRIYRSDDTEQQEQTLSGWLRVRHSGVEYQDPLLVSLCAEVSESGGDLDGMRLFVEDQVVMPWDWYDRLEVRLLNDHDITALEAAEEPLNSLELAPSPMLSLANLTYYQASTHTAHWEPWFTEFLENQLPTVGFYGLPFVVLVDGERIYLGAFITSLSSATFRHPVIVMEDLGEDSAVIEAGWPHGPGGPDPRSDSRILEVLRETAKLVP